MTSPVSLKRFLPLKWGGFLLFFLLAVLVVALAGFLPSQFGHTGADEIQFETKFVTQTCADKFCSAVCPENYYVTGGGCGVASPRFTQFNLMGADGNRTSWNCFDSAYKSWSIPPTSSIIANAICLKTGGYAPTPYEFCGNYTIEPNPTLAGPSNISEICDMNNTALYDCGDFFTNSGEHLCNGNLQCDTSALNQCRGYDVSTCNYCLSGGCPPPYQYCADFSCQLSCDGIDSGVPVGVVGSCSPLISCPSIPDPPDYPAGGFCGDGLPQLNEQCDGDQSVCPGPTPPYCQPGYEAVINPSTCTAGCTCENHVDCIPIPPNCGNGTIDSGETCDASAPGSIADQCGGSQTGGYWSCVVCQCVWHEV